METLFLDIFESRAFRNVSTMEKYTLNQLSEIFLWHLFILNILQYENEDFAIKYAKDTLQYSQFDGIRLAATDLGNLTATLIHSDRYLDEKPRPVPEFQLRRYLRSIKKDCIDKYFVESLFLKIQKDLKVNNNLMNSLRRDVCGYKLLNDYEKLTLCDKIYNQIRKSSYIGDLVTEFHRILENK